MNQFEMSEIIDTQKTSPQRKTVAGAILSVGMLITALAVVFFAWLAEEVFEGDSVKIDSAVREFVHSFASGWLTVTMQFFSFLGSTVFLSAATLLTVSILLLRRKFRPAVIIGIVMAGAVILNNVLKISFSRDRPLPYFDTPLPASFSFPSGHALLSVCFYGALAWLISLSLKRTSAKVALWSVTALMALCIGLSRIYLGVHYPTDVLAGYLAAIVWLICVRTADSVLVKPADP